MSGVAGQDCEHCVFWRQLEPEGQEGECRRHSPAVIVVKDKIIKVRPNTNAKDWCGEYGVPL